MNRRSGDTYNGIIDASWSYPFPVGACGKFEVDGGTGVVTIVNDFNITSATEGATGVYTVTFTAGVADAIIMLTVEDGPIIELSTYSESAPVIVTRNASGTAIRPTSFTLLAYRPEQDNL
jgi:hypothetical protein